MSISEKSKNQKPKMIQITEKQYEEYVAYKLKHEQYKEVMKYHNKRCNFKFITCEVCNIEMKYKSMFLHSKSKSHLLNKEKLDKEKAENNDEPFVFPDPEGLDYGLN